MGLLDFGPPPISSMISFPSRLEALIRLLSPEISSTKGVEIMDVRPFTSLMFGTSDFHAAFYCP